MHISRLAVQPVVKRGELATPTNACTERLTWDQPAVRVVGVTLGSA